MEKESKSAALTPDEKRLLITVSCIAAGLGAVLGIIAYYQQWLF